MITDVENIILNKEYFELTAEELESVGELVQNAEEYDEMKWFLASTNQALVSDKIEATPELKEKVMAHLHQDEPQRRFWLNGIAVFLWPTEKEFYRRPAFQMSLAALLLIGFLMVYNQNIEPDNNMAINDLIEIEESEDAGSEAESFEVEDETTFEPRTTEESNEQVLDGLTKPRGGDLGGGEGITRSPMDERLVLDDEVDPAEEPVTDMDGYYSYDLESAEERKEDADNSISNANNNERPNTVLLSEISSNDDNSNENIEYRREEKLKDEGKERDKNRTGTKDRKALNKKSKMSSSDDFDALVEEDNNNNSGSGPGNTGETEINVDEEPANSGIYNTVTIDGGFGNTVTNDIIPFQQSVKQTPELKKLFTSFK